MTQQTKPPRDSPLARWSRLKREAAREKEKEKDRAATAPTDAVVPPVTAGAKPATSFGAEAALSGNALATSTGDLPSITPGASRDAAGDAPRNGELPAVESLTFDSDFAPYFEPQVDAALKRRALKQLLRDPRFNVMDGLDVYIDDYTQPDPIPPEIVREMVQGRYIFDPPPTRINAQGHVEDVPPEELATLREAKGATGDAALESNEASPTLANSGPDVAAIPATSSLSEDEDPPVAIPSDAPVAKDDSAR